MAKAKAKSKFKSMRDKVRERAIESEQSGGSNYLNLEKGTNFFQPKKGKYKIDIIPYVVTDNNHPEGVEAGDLWWRRKIYVHYGIGAADKGYICLKSIEKRCPICDELAKLRRDANADEEVLKALKPKERDLMQVIDLDNEDKGIQLWEYSSYLFSKKLEEEIRQGDEELGDFANLEDGKTLGIRFAEKALGKNKFLEVDRIDFNDRDDYDEDILEDGLDLDGMLKILPYEKLEAIYLEIEDDKPEKKSSKKSKDDDDEEETPKRKPKASREEEKPKRKTKPPVEDDDEEEEEEEEEKPVKKKAASKPEPKKSSKKKPVDDDDDEEEEEEEEPTPKKGKAKAKPSDDDEECPVEDGTFGVDCDEYDECLDCDVWKECKAAQKALKKKK